MKRTIKLLLAIAIAYTFTSCEEDNELLIEQYSKEVTCLYGGHYGPCTIYCDPNIEAEDFCLICGEDDDSDLPPPPPPPPPSN